MTYQFEDFEDAGDLAEIVDVEAGRGGDGGVDRVGVVATDDAVVQRFGRSSHHDDGWSTGIAR